MIMAMVTLGLLPPLVVLVTMASLATPIYGSCSSGDPSYAASVSYSQSYTQVYTTVCMLIVTCPASRTRYRTAYRYETTCCPGFSGSSCTDINECLSNPCLNGGTCSNQQGSFSCSCAGGWWGTRCQYDLDLNVCWSGPCLNGGQCNNFQDTFSCTCNSGWIGTRCQTEIDLCDVTPCQNGGTCTFVDSTRTCRCPSTHQGVNCETEIDLCDVTPCQNGGTCTFVDSTRTCGCPSTHQGVNCETEIDLCDVTPCQNGGTCTFVDSTRTCGCPSTHQGVNCEIDPICSCDFDLDLCTFTQATTDNIDWTRLAGNTPSMNTGPENDHTIGTAAGFYIYTEATSHFNKVAVLESELILASSGRLCADFWYHMWGADIGTLNIYAKTGTTLGQVLWTQSGADLSRNWFEAQIDFIPTADFKFVFEGVTGASFQSDIALDDIYITTGACRDVNECSSGPCLNGGSCNNLENAFSCTCNSGWIGTRCQTDVNECSSGPCLNGGSCNNLENAFSCTCDFDWIGTRCETDFNVGVYPVDAFREEEEEDEEF